ncbi:hypothetical protein DAMA08_039220 [Martiniozyma asiatica (nom. inval.)]|nr:hypothetical protein DAMA08_039220 [Martiniozyma asiatica]
MTQLKEVEPEPVKNIPGIPVRQNSHPYILKAINVLQSIQYNSVLPFGLFSVIHLSSVVVTPAIFGIEAGNMMISTGRELYHVPIVEIGLLGSALAHVISGFALNITRKFYNYKKYGMVNPSIADEKRMKSDVKEQEEVKDPNEGLGGITSMLGLGSRKSLTSKYLGLSPLSFSGYMLVVLLGAHVYQLRLVPLMVDGDSSFVDISFITHLLQKEFLKLFTLMNLMVVIGVYHMAAGWNRINKQFSRTARKRAYFLTIGLALLSTISLWKIGGSNVAKAMAKRFARYC